MEESYFDKMADFAIQGHETCTPEQLKRQVRTALMEVERDTRHKSSDMAYKLANDIHNMRHD